MRWRFRERFNLGLTCHLLFNNSKPEILVLILALRLSLRRRRDRVNVESVAWFSHLHSLLVAGTRPAFDIPASFVTVSNYTPAVPC